MKIIPLLFLLVLAGCSSIQKLPPVTAESLEYRRTDPLGGTSITASGVKKLADGSLAVDSVTWDTTYPQFSVKLTLKGYKQEK